LEIQEHLRIPSYCLLEYYGLDGTTIRLIK